MTKLERLKDVAEEMKSACFYFENEVVFQAPNDLGP